MCEALTYLIYDIFIKFGIKLRRQVVCIPLETNWAPLITDLFLFCFALKDIYDHFFL